MKILIISENNDIVTDRVIEWLHFYKVSKIIRINEDTLTSIKEINIKENNIVLFVEGEEINISEIDYFWYRRGKINFDFSSYINNSSSRIDRQIYHFLQNEWRVCHDFLVYFLEEGKCLGSPSKANTNKLVNLKVAKECGFEIPDSCISGSRKNMLHFVKKRKCISKPISEMIPIYARSGFYKMYTCSIDESTFYQEENVFPSLLQEEIEKNIEIRVFVLFEKIFAMAIFSQNNSKTNIDYRNYDFAKMNRMIPYQLPIDIEEKILKFMKVLGLNTGSIDLIKTNENKYVFLEINPSGNIEIISDNCNYNIEKIIAETIISNNYHGQ